MEKHQVAERYAKALHDRDLVAIDGLLHTDIVARYPQSGEVFSGRDNYLRMLAEYPMGLPVGDVTSVKGESTTVVLPRTLPFGSPSVTVYGGDQFVIEGVATYPDGSVFNMVILIRLQGGLVIEETSYFAEPFEAPEWRRPFLDQPGGDSE